MVESRDLKAGDKKNKIKKKICNFLCLVKFVSTQGIALIT